MSGAVDNKKRVQGLLLVIPHVLPGLARLTPGVLQHLPSGSLENDRQAGKGSKREEERGERRRDSSRPVAVTSTMSDRKNR